MHNLFLRIKNQLSVFTTHNSSRSDSSSRNQYQPTNSDFSVLKTPRTRHNSAPDMELQHSRSLKSIRVRKISKGSLKSLRRGTVCVTVSTHASSVFYDTDMEVMKFYPTVDLQYLYVCLCVGIYVFYRSHYVL